MVLTIKWIHRCVIVDHEKKTVQKLFFDNCCGYIIWLLFILISDDHFFFKQYALLFALFSKEDCIFISKWSEKVGFLKAKYACASDIKTLHLCKFTFSNSLSLRVPLSFHFLVFYLLVLWPFLILLSIAQKIKSTQMKTTQYCSLCSTISN